MSSFGSAAYRSAGIEPDRSPVSPAYCYSILAAAEPGVMARVLGVFAKRGLMPSRWHSAVDDRGELQIDIQVADLAPEPGEYLARRLRQIVNVETVLTSRKDSTAEVQRGRRIGGRN